jgi:type III secretory pathway lipoprotein EscJ
VFPLQEDAQKFIEDRAQLLNASEQELTQALSKFDGYLVQVVQIKDSLGREVTAVAGDNRIHREGRIRGVHQHR